jgi:hypothetical protein
MSVPYLRGLLTAERSMIRHNGTVGPLTPWMMRPTKSRITSGAMAA